MATLCCFLWSWNLLLLKALTSCYQKRQIGQQSLYHEVYKPDAGEPGECTCLVSKQNYGEANQDREALRSISVYDDTGNTEIIGECSRWTEKWNYLSYLYQKFSCHVRSQEEGQSRIVSPNDRMAEEH